MKTIRTSIFSYHNLYKHLNSTSFSNSCRRFSCRQQFTIRTSTFYNINQRILIDERFRSVLDTPYSKRCYQRRENQTLSHKETLEKLRNDVKIQGENLQKLEASGASDKELQKASVRLKSLIKEVEKFSLPQQDELDRDAMHRLAAHKMYFKLAFEPYGGVAGLYDYGHVGTGILRNMLHEWHVHFVLRDQMQFVTGPTLMPEAVLKASGHTAKFSDTMVKDSVTGDRYRLDHLIKEQLQRIMHTDCETVEAKYKIEKILSRLDDLSVTELEEILNEYHLRSPSGNAFGSPQAMNLMFPVGTDEQQYFLRPETAQNIFLNFPDLLASAHGRLPFAVAQVGSAYRNEVYPHPKLLRLRQFTMAEIEHFCHPMHKDHPKFSEVSGEILTLYSASQQLAAQEPVSLTIGEAVNSGMVANETVGYYMARIQQYLLRIGINYNKLRFRQHLSNEMAHYACDCWDAECLTSYGWLECVGCADRSAYDLTAHAVATGGACTVTCQLDTPHSAEVVVPQIDSKFIKRSFNKRDAKLVINTLKSLSQSQISVLQKAMEEDGKAKVPNTDIVIGKSCIPSFEREMRTVTDEEIVPCVIEPSFGIERIYYALLEHTYSVRDDKKRTYFSLSPKICPIKVSIIPLSQRHRNETMPLINKIASELLAEEVAYKIDLSSGSIGRRYVRTDELSVPYIITLDMQTLSSSPPTVTLRERDSTAQLRLPMEEVSDTVTLLAKGRLSWQDCVAKWPHFTEQQTAE